MTAFSCKEHILVLHQVKVARVLYSLGFFVFHLNPDTVYVAFLFVLLLNINSRQYTLEMFGSFEFEVYSFVSTV